MRIAFIAALAAAALGFVGCSTSSKSGNSGHACTPGQSVACVGPGGCAGGQVCNAAGTGFGSCLCGLPGDGGNPHPDSGNPHPDSGNPHPDSGLTDSGKPDGGPVCDLLAQTGCTGGDRCGIVKSTVGSIHAGCTPPGTKALYAACSFGVSGADDCQAGLACEGGECRKLCDIATPTCAAGSVCDAVSGIVAGICDPTCNPVTQTRERDGAAACGSPNPAAPTLGCYGIPGTPFTCQPVVNPGNTQGVTVAPPGSGSYVNACAPGFMILPGPTIGPPPYATICTAFCQPASTTLQSHPSPGGVSPYSCGDRGAGGSNECRFVQLFDGVYTGAPFSTIGFCFDYTQNTDVMIGVDPNAPMHAPAPSCSTVSATADANTNGVLDAVEWGCVPRP